MNDTSGLQRVGDIILILFPELKNDNNGSTNKRGHNIFFIRC